MKTLSFLVVAFALTQFAPVTAQSNPRRSESPLRRTGTSRSGVPAGAMDSPAVRKQQFNLEEGVAIQGYDAVAYFIQNKAVRGSADNAFTYKNITYRFATPANLKAFQDNPEKYEPQYGGWCAYAMGANGEKVEVDPETFSIKDGKLFLFYHTFLNNTLTKWNKDEPNLHRKADASWNQFIQS